MKIFRYLLVIVLTFAAFNAQADTLKILVKKQARTLEVLKDNKVVKTYTIALGFAPKGTKIRQGDGKTPEGIYHVRIKNAASQFYLSLGLSYPNAQDAERGLEAGLISKAQYQAILRASKQGKIPPWNTKLGGEIFIHGGGNSSDWTWGCIALENADIKELFATVSLGTEVEIRP
ncbi:MAG: L,D-transpeptidase family protein [Methylobacillus sp.]|jgi:murein L,D-transpeptidase YafK|nr:L,D-transpeptidase family protein [Methylobacillus sp.]